jgi:hypothetical protein
MEETVAKFNFPLLRISFHFLLVTRLIIGHRFRLSNLTYFFLVRILSVHTVFVRT